MTILEVFEAVGAHAAGRIDDDELRELEEAASPGVGACGGQFTANTMAMVFEVLGLSPMGSAMVPAAYEDKNRVAAEAGALIMDVLARGQRPRDIITRDGLENAIAAIATSGGSTNGVLHLLALAREAGVELTSTTSTGSRARRRRRATSSPAGASSRRTSTRPAVSRVVAKRLLEAGMLHEDAQTVTGKTLGEHAREAVETPGQDVVRPVDDPFKQTGGLAILRGNLAPDGCVVKLAGHERVHHSGPARVFECEEDAMAAVTAGAIVAGDVVVIRNEGPAGGPGMREMLAVTAALVGRGARRGGRAADRRPLLRRDARLYGRPRRARGAARRPDRGRPRRRHDHDRRAEPALDLELSDDEIARRLAA